ncbi:CD63 antigen-like 2 [Homarus americanus]|uniref:Tetraspanin n=1 Tax=Homarus americanus TaxID=6706 RepID=A0A8J5MPN7_HOMAM|nr:CD63 antigen-like 2 [Homarus americanus]
MRWMQLSGLALIVIGGIAQGFFSSYIEFFNGKYETPAIGIIILGGIILVISFFGCCGAKKENVFMLRIFGFLMVIVLLLECAAAITVLVMKTDIKNLVKRNMNETMDKYGDPKNLYFCCGTEDYMDWNGTTYGMNVSGVPDTCCKNIVGGCGYKVFDSPSKIPTTIYTTGCFQALSDSAHAKLGAVIGGIVILVLLQIVGIWMSCWLIQAVKERYEVL